MYWEEQKSARAKSWIDAGILSESSLKRGTIAVTIRSNCRVTSDLGVGPAAAADWVRCGR